MDQDLHCQLLIRLTFRFFAWFLYY